MVRKNVKSYDNLYFLYYFETSVLLISKVFTKKSDLYAMKRFYVFSFEVVFRILLMANFLLIGVGCMLNSTLVVEKTEKDIESTPIHPEPYNPDMVVIGQPNWYSVQTNNSYDPKAYNLALPRGIVKMGNKYFISDYLNNRVLVFENSISGTPAYVLGQPDFTSGIINNNGGFHEVSARGFLSPTQIATDGTHLAVADASNNRVLIWNSIPTSSFSPADVVVGQVDFQHRLGNRGASTPSSASLYGPTGVIFVGQKLIISDQSNNRILIYNSVPASNGAAADVVIGQADFTTMSINRTGSTTLPSNKSLYFPYYLSSNGTQLLVADGYNNRVLVWNSVPTGFDVAADVVIGQPSFTSNLAAASQAGLNLPRHMLVINNALYISDTNNNRIVYHATIPSSPGVSATAVIGQGSFTNGSSNRGLAKPAANSLAFPTFLAHFDGSLWVSDSTNSRLLKFSLPPTPTNIIEGSAIVASDTWGQPSLITGYPNQVVSPNEMGFGRISGVCAHEKWLLAADVGNQRFLVFDRSDFSSGAISVIGQMDFNSNLANQGAASPAANTLSVNATGLDPACAFDSRGRLYISDNNNNRVLVWNQIPLTKGVNADFVFGQANFTTASAQGCSDSGLNRPTGIAVINDKLVVNDYGYNRTLIFDVSTANLKRTADLVIGAPNLTSCSGGTSASLAKLPWSTTWDGSRLFIVEYANNRIMVYNTFPSTNGVAADFVIGQPDFTSVLSGTSANRFLKSTNGGIRGSPTVFNNFLLSTDYYNQRILAFDLTQLSSGMNASYVFSQPDLNTGFGTVLPGNFSNTAFEQLWLAMGIHNFQDDDFIWISDSVRLIRVKKSKFFNYSK